ncbi:hypothetical protein [Nitrospirillum iridis]|uniref:Uncharacterized protein n=1 Tax=Nitrospirillum iridis TaxID=765888 RepID=A0A7X0B260_9PROT|nr:hypothetical protein [Nitrospirillum iridis]MBB6253026.1 hypothetical protein [Nitrospirillum iridis]
MTPEELAVIQDGITAEALNGFLSRAVAETELTMFQDWLSTDELDKGRREEIYLTHRALRGLVGTIRTKITAYYELLKSQAASEAYGESQHYE